MTLAQSGLIGSIYPAEMLEEKKHAYSHFLLQFYEEAIRPLLGADEARAVGEINFRFPLNLPGQEPVGFCARHGTIILSIASLKLLNDLLLAYCWLGRHGYKPVTIDDYLMMLVHWRSDSTPPEPLPCLGIPDNAGSEAGIEELHAVWVRHAYVFILLHELGHLRHGDTTVGNISRSELRARERRADQFALNVMGRLGFEGSGIAQFFEWAWVFMPNPDDYPDEDSYWNALQNQTHPVTTDRLLDVAEDIDANAGKYATDQEPETLAAFQNLSRALKLLASLKGDPDLQRKAFRRASFLRPEDLAPRRPNEMIAMPVGAPASQGPFQGKLVGSVGIGAISQDIEVTLQNRASQVTGAYTDGVEIGRIDGTVTENSLNFRWVLGELQGSGLLGFDGRVYSGTIGMGGSPVRVAWNLHPA